MINIQAQVGDLIRITGECDGDIAIGDIMEVTDANATNRGLFTKGGGYVRHESYVIHRKAGEEDSPKSKRDGFDIIREGLALQGMAIKGDVNADSPNMVDSPTHYTQGKFETIEVIENLTSKYDDGFTAHCVGTAFKYMDRAPLKHDTPIECIRKAARYLEYAIAHEQRKIDGK